MRNNYVATRSLRVVRHPSGIASYTLLAVLAVGKAPSCPTASMLPEKTALLYTPIPFEFAADSN